MTLRPAGHDPPEEMEGIEIAVLFPTAGQSGVFGDRLMQILASIAVLLFISRAVLPRGRGRYAWATWARWGAIAAFSAAICYALGMTLLWALAASR
jgi:hypothetical protein